MPFVKYRTWNERLHALKNYKAEKGDCNVPLTYKPDRSLGAWVNTQRQEYRKFMMAKKSSMTASRIADLDALDFEWDPYSTSWSLRFDELRAFRRQHGHCSVPRTYKANRALARWVVRQRENRRLARRGQSSGLTEARERALNELGFVWDVIGAQGKGRERSSAAGLGCGEEEDSPPSFVFAEESGVAEEDTAAPPAASPPAWRGTVVVADEAPRSASAGSRRRPAPSSTESPEIEPKRARIQRRRAAPLPIPSRSPALRAPSSSSSSLCGALPLPSPSSLCRGESSSAGAQVAAPSLPRPTMVPSEKGTPTTMRLFHRGKCEEVPRTLFRKVSDEQQQDNQLHHAIDSPQHKRKLDLDLACRRAIMQGNLASPLRQTIPRDYIAAPSTDLVYSFLKERQNDTMKSDIMSGHEDPMVRLLAGDYCSLLPPSLTSAPLSCLPQFHPGRAPLNNGYGKTSSQNHRPLPPPRRIGPSYFQGAQKNRSTAGLVLDKTDLLLRQRSIDLVKRSRIYGPGSGRRPPMMPFSPCVAAASASAAGARTEEERPLPPPLRQLSALRRPCDGEEEEDCRGNGRRNHDASSSSSYPRPRRGLSLLASVCSDDSSSSAESPTPPSPRPDLLKSS
uniref:Helicase-associated domain-containing protein n=1 Tax=Pseudictyota dubia TaxID=2749911 RepID=A0A7R9W8J9_9STRA|mmetsp:Transcript_37913/g.69997  ORF Transcript_37913/g.69997 Transcript_37913/m.69997 type:complete len:622 (+) Transcript_37913:51-1916(+)|eukprot:CAMPEP_0197451416 /NCGR_PEP_ID=MMETSP1175-20131217/28766_1 /TAXON_ID=1003142 /ORGANISM="Triceratium dubium, Strain CCMP147" /LENGTH=621 /DNA_ID=CAMNT_0042984123 /DNA_START=51 /DNA_END=1916 /DNA_ORIENTATION=+